MPFFIKNPITIEAVRWNGNFAEMEQFVGGCAEVRNGKLLVATLEGPLTASDGDWIIKGVKGEFYPCKPDIFEATYETISETSILPRADLFKGSYVKRQGFQIETMRGYALAHTGFGQNRSDVAEELAKEIVRRWNHVTRLEQVKSDSKTKKGKQ